MLDLNFFVDTYYAYDFNRPREQRVFTTQPTKHDSPSINLAYVDWKLNQDRIRSRLAFHAGDSVERNAITEPGLEKYIQESYVGYKINEKLWLDAGIFLGHIGAETWFSNENWNYTRALSADYVPYYSTGLRLSYQQDSQTKYQLQLINGWQNISENNGSKAIGFQFLKGVSEKTTFTYNNFFGDEQVTSTNPRFRGYHNFIIHYKVDDLWEILSSFDIGHQSQQDNTGLNSWAAVTTSIKRVIDFNRKLGFRIEHYNDANESNVKTVQEKGFLVSSGSVNYDQILLGKILWRTEYRLYYSPQKIYPRGNESQTNKNEIVVTSVAVNF